MRQIGFVLTLGALLPAAGCTTAKWNIFRNGGGQPVSQVPTAAALVTYLNDNADRVQSVRCNRLDLKVSRRLLSINLDGKMVCQKPRNFRMKAYLMDKDELDLGSNQDEFWFWIARGDPYQFHCSYQALDQGKVRQLPFPFQPDWIIEALGIARLEPEKPYQVTATRNNTIELVERARSPQGKPMRKVTVFRATQARNGEPQVLAHRLVDEATGNEICSAQITQVQMVRTRDATGQEVLAVLPKEVVLYWPENKVRLTMTLGEITVNEEITRPDVVFARRPLANIPSFDLAEWRVDGQPSSIQRVEGRGWQR